MKIILNVMQGAATVEWDSSMCDDATEVHKVALDVSATHGTPKKDPLYTPEEVVRNFIFDNQKNLDYSCPVCAALKKVGMTHEDMGQEVINFEESEEKAE